MRYIFKLRNANFFQRVIKEYIALEVYATFFGITWYFTQPHSQISFIDTLLLHGNFNSNFLYDFITYSIWLFIIIIACNLLMKPIISISHFIKHHYGIRIHRFINDNIRKGIDDARHDKMLHR